MSRVAAMQSTVDDLARKHSHRRLYSAGNADEDVTLESKYAPLQSIAKRPGLAADAAAQQAVRTFTTDNQLMYNSCWIAAVPREDMGLGEGSNAGLCVVMGGQGVCGQGGQRGLSVPRRRRQGTLVHELAIIILCGTGARSYQRLVLSAESAQSR